MSNIHARALATVVVLVSLARWASGQCALERLVPGDGAANDFFGNAVELSGDIAFVGAPLRDSGGLADSGAVYVLQRVDSAWQEIAILVPSSPNADEQFGFSLDAGAGRLLIGAPGNELAGAAVGAAYVFDLQAGNWTQTARLRASDPLAHSGFARSVALDAGTVAVGAWGATGANGATTGAAYVYELGGGSWSQTAKLFDPFVTTNHDFGYSVGISGDTILAGTPFYDGVKANCGAVHVFDRSGSIWSMTSVLTSSDAEHLSFFGSDVALDGARAIASATGTNDQLSAVYFFERQAGTWTEVDAERPPTKDGGEWFGYGVALAGDRAAVGSRLDDAVGSAYSYRRTGTDWQLEARIVDPEGGPQALFGQSVALEGGLLIVGGPKAFPASGSATAFDLESGLETSYCSVNLNSTGLPASLDFTGSFSIAENSCSLLCRDCPPNQFGVFFYGGAPNQVVFGNGFLCIAGGAGGIYRLSPALAIDASGDATRPLDFTVPPLGSGAGEIHPGEDWYFQFWYRDPMGGGSGFNLSQGLELVLCP